MKYIYLSMVFAFLVPMKGIPQQLSPFLWATKSTWYMEFLCPVVNAISQKTSIVEVLDIGTGPGTLPQMLIEKNESLKVTGIDIDSTMIAEANKRFHHDRVVYQIQQNPTRLGFAEAQFDAVTICSVLFFLNDTTRQNLLKEALRVIKPGGSIYILTPSGKKAVYSSLFEVWNFKPSFFNFTFPIWKIATTQGGRAWEKENWAKKFACTNQLNYSAELTFSNNAFLEILTKK